MKPAPDEAVTTRFVSGSTSAVACSDARSLVGAAAPRPRHRADPRDDLTEREESLARAHFKSQISDLKSLAESCSRQLHAWADSLKDSDIKGQRHLNQQTREEDDRRKRAAACQKLLLGKLPPDHPLVRGAKEKGVL